MPEGGNLTIETANAFLDEAYASSQLEVLPGQYVVISVTDTGCGMTKEVAAKAFEPFFTTKDVGHGTGLGLSQVYGFVKQSGGHVKIYSEVGQGTTIKIYLPRLLAAKDSVLAQDSVSDSVRSDGTETILIVEDDDGVRANTTEILNELGYRTLEADSGKRALQILQLHPEIQLLFTDVGLPGGMNGRQLADQARTVRGVKILFTTGYARNAIVHDGRLDPGVHLITKPFTYTALASKLRDVLDTKSSVGRVLLVEDEVLIQLNTIEHLEEFGFEVEVAGSATEAMNKLRIMNGNLEAAIVDIGLPNRNGEIFIGEIRATYPSLPIIVASGQSKEALRNRFGSDKRILFLGKPYISEQLREALAALNVHAK
jgi:CheY-like chemotaxis protein